MASLKRFGANYSIGWGWELWRLLAHPFFNTEPHSKNPYIPNKGLLEICHMNKKRSFIKRFRRNIRRLPRRIERFSCQLDKSFGKVIFGGEDSPSRKPSHVVATVACSLVAGYGVSRFLGGALANKYSALEGGGLMSSGWGGMLIILLLLAGFNTVTLLLLIDRQVQGDVSATHRIGTAIAAWGGEDESQSQAKPDQQS